MEHKTFNTDFYKFLIFELVSTAFIGAGILPGIFVYLLLGIFAAFIITKPLKEGLNLFLISLPLFLALPGFNSMSIWRPLSALIIVYWLWEKRDILWENPLVFWEKLWERKGILYITIASFLFLFVTTVSLLWARDMFIGIKTILYLTNILLIFFVYAWETTKEDFVPFLASAGAMSAFVLLIGFLQIAVTFFVPFYDFWQWWAKNPILAYYGEQTSELLSYSNTWFSYYGKDIPETLRIFSLFQDSHAFAMFSILEIAVWGALFFFFKDKHTGKGVLLSIGLVLACFLAIILSGSRGSWVAAGLLAVILLFFKFSGLFIRRIPVNLVYKSAAALSIFFLFFPLSSLILAGEQKAQLIMEGRGVEEPQLRLAFLRLRSSVDVEELSNKGRLEIWEDSFRFLSEKKFLTGTGIGNFPTAIKLTPEKSRLGASAHSLYLQFLVELGIFGFIVFLAILFLIIKQAYRLVTSYKLQATSYYAFAFLFAFSWILLYSLVDVTLLNDKVLLFLAILTGILYSCENNNNHHYEGKI